MKLSDLKQQIEELDAAEVDDKSYWTGEFIQGQRNILFHHHGPELRRLLVAEEALVQLMKLYEDSFDDAAPYRPEWLKSALKTISGEEE